MRDDDDLPVLNAVVKEGDEAVILSTRLGLALDPARELAPRRRLAGRPAAPAPTLETDDVARIDLGAARTDPGAVRSHPGAARPDLGTDGPIGIDASRDRPGRRASRQLADLVAALPGEDELASEIAARRVRDTATDALAAARSAEELDDTLELDDPVPVRRRARAPRRERHVSVVPPARLPRSAVAANDRVDAGTSRESSDIARLERLVDEIVERHVAALRRDVRTALLRALGTADPRRA